MEKQGIHLHRASRIAAVALLLALCALASALGVCVNSAAAAQGQLAIGEVAPDEMDLRTQSASNAKGKASSVGLFRYGWVHGVYSSSRQKTTNAYDVTGDARGDVVKVRLIGEGLESGRADKFVIWVNGSQSYVLDAPPEGFDYVEVALITLRNNKPFLFASAYGVDGSAFQQLLQYRKGSFQVVVDNGLLQRKGTSDVRISSARPSGNRVVVQYDLYTTVTGLTRTSFVYAYRSGTLKRTGDTANALLCAQTGTGVGAYARQARKATRAFTAYSNVSFSKKAFKARKNSLVRPVALRLSKGRLLYRVQCGSKRGWIACASTEAHGGKRLLKGTYGASPLKSSPPAYSRTKLLGILQLYKYGNHALYLARNEVYARHGKVFASSELNEYFRSLSWYTPRSGASVKLNEKEAKNVANMLAIEKARKSPYVS